MGIDGPRLFLVATALAAGTLAVAAGCSSKSSGTDPAMDLGDADLALGDGGRKASLAEASACLASTGAAPTCADPCNAQCTLAVSSFKPDVAASIQSCLAASSDCAASAQTCVANAAGAACDDEGAASFCTSFIASCPETLDGGTTSDQTQSDCVGLVRAMSDSGRTALQTCATSEQGNCATCITSLRSLTAPAH